MTNLLDELYSGVFEYENQTTYLEKYLYYKAQKNDGKDADVCEHMCNVYKANVGYIPASAVIERQCAGNPYKHQIVFNGIAVRGDTLFNVWSILSQIINYDQETKIKASADSRLVGRIKECPLIDDALRDKLNNFARLAYTKGNFIAIPFKDRYHSLNTAKYTESDEGYGENLQDSAQQYFLNLCRYFSGSRISSRVCQLVESHYPLWRDRYKQPDGIDIFIRDNKLQPFFEGTEPKMFWAKTGDIYADIDRYITQVSKAIELRNNLLQEG